MAKFAVILAAAGKSGRFKDKNYKKPFAPLANRAVWLHSAEKFLDREDVKQLLLVIAAEDREYFQFKFAANAAILGIDVVDGGQHRADSIQRALARVKPGHRFRRRARCRPALPGRRMDQQRVRRRRKKRRGDPGDSGGGHAEARGRRSHDRRNRAARRSVGSPNAASFPPATAVEPMPSAAISPPPTMPSLSNGSAMR